MMDNIKKCPMCGGEGLVRESGSSFNHSKLYIRCTRCGLRTRGTPSEESAVVAWNQRTECCGKGEEE